MDSIDDKAEARRLELVLQERKIAERKQSDSREFGKYINTRQASKEVENGRSNKAVRQVSDAQNRLNAKSGIQTNAMRAGQLRDSNKGGGGKRTLSHREETQDSRVRQDAQHAEHERVERQQGKAHNAPISRDDGHKGGKGDGGAGAQTGGQHQQAAAQVAATPTFQMQNTQTVQKSSGGAALTQQQMIDSIVKNVRQGVSAKGLGVIQIDLKDDVMSGSSLMISRDKDGAISVKVSTLDEQVKNLMEAGDSMQVLQKAFADKHIVLKDFSVDVAGR